MSERIAHAGLRGKVMTADEAAAFINPGDLEKKTFYMWHAGDRVVL